MSRTFTTATDDSLIGLIQGAKNVTRMKELSLSDRSDAEVDTWIANHKRRNATDNVTSPHEGADRIDDVLGL
jgi:hypothetical protein